MPAQVTDSIYDLVGAEAERRARLQTVEKVFTGMDSDRDGMVSRDEFLEYCSRNNRWGQMMGSVENWPRILWTISFYDPKLLLSSFKIGCLRRPIWADWKLRLEQNYWKYFALLAGGEEQILNLIIASAIQIAKLTLARAWIKVCRRAGASKFKYFMFSVFTTASPSCPRGHSGPNKDNVSNLMTQKRDSSISSTYIYPSIITLNEYSLSSSRSHVLDNLNRYSAFCVFIQIIPKDSFKK